MPIEDWRDGAFRGQRPSPETLAWVSESTGPGWQVARWQPLTGGVSSAVHLIVVKRHGVSRFVVLRQYPGGIGLTQTVRQELANLILVADSGLPVPSVIAADVEGTATGGHPSVLMTHLPGRVDLSPSDPVEWLHAIAQLAVQVHALDLPAPLLDPWSDSWIAARSDLRVPKGARDPGVWMAAISLVHEPAPADEVVFLHGDFLPVNLLWSEGRLSGLVDWTGIHRGSRAYDVGQCRRYVAAMVSPDWAQQLLTHYESLCGHRVNPWWDIYALLHHDDDQAKWIAAQVSGRRPVDLLGLTSRVEATLKLALQRLG